MRFNIFLVLLLASGCANRGSFRGDVETGRGTASTSASLSKEDAELRIEQREARRGNAKDPDHDVLATEPDKQADRAEGSKEGERRGLNESRLGKFQKATELIGVRVSDRNGERLGEIKDFVVDMDGGRVPFALLSMGGFLGTADRVVPLPPGALAVREDETFQVKLDHGRLASAPSLESGKWRDVDDVSWREDVYRYYGTEPYWTATTRREGDQRGRSRDQRETSRVDESNAAERSKGDVKVDESATGLVKASDLIGKGVQNHSDERLGDVKDLMIDLSSGRVSYAVLSIGGFLGIGDKLVAVPITALVSKDDGSLLLNADRKRLEGAPSFDEKRWPDFSNPVWGANIYKYHGQEPYWKSHIGASDDLRGDSDGDVELRGSASDSEREIARKIRRGIVADAQLSFSAKNVHIDVEDGRVTLRGAVRSEEEKRDMEMRAKATAGVKEVRNELEVKRD